MISRKKSSRTAKALFAIAAGVMLNGCTDASIEALTEYQEFKVHSAIDRARNVSDPWEAYQLLSRDAEQAASKALCYGGQRFDCRSVSQKTKARYEKERDQYSARAVTTGNPSAIIAAYDSGLLLQRPDLQKIVLDHGSVTANEPARRQILAVAAKLVTNPKSKFSDPEMVSQYVHLAWRAGDPMAPKWGVQYFIRKADAQNAYLWAIRCESPCALDAADVRSIAELTTAKQRLRAVMSEHDADSTEKAARDPLTVSMR